ncbi:hypothetical protein ACIOG8_12630 [Streptomyces erythrochromogenes]|uniref:hypothetical protein n=1 Tax=Streptomyces erythrochromogenes TaxID=285574 RepID=UPI0037F2E824
MTGEPENCLIAVADDEAEGTAGLPEAGCLHHWGDVLLDQQVQGCHGWMPFLSRTIAMVRAE